MPDTVAGPFVLDRGRDRGVLCIHGFTGSPYEVRPLAEHFASLGMTAVGPLLPGHGRDARAMNATTWHDWTTAMGAELDALRARCRHVAIAGLSLGGLITLYLAARYPYVRAITLLSTPLWLQPWVMAAARVLGHLQLDSWPKSGADIRDGEARRAFPSATAFPIPALASLIDLMGRVRDELPQVRVPSLIVHADQDHVAPAACGRELERRLGSADKRLVRLPRSFHIVTVDVDREVALGEAGRFLAERL